MKYLTKDEIWKLLVSATNKRDKCLIQLGLVTGCRVSEIVGIRVAHIKSGVIKVYDHKKDIYREVVIDHDTAGMISEYLAYGWKAEGYGPQRLFYFSTRTANRILKRACKAAEIPPEKAHFHVLRHTYVVQSLEAGVPINHVCEQTGDSATTIISIYGRPSTDARREMIAHKGAYWR
jgi:integrase/recombinase XerD